MKAHLGFKVALVYQLLLNQSMSVTAIKQAIKSIRKLPKEKREEVSKWVINEVAENTIHGHMKRAMECGKFNGLILQGLKQYAAGKCLKTLHP